MTDQQLAEFARESTQAALLAMLIAGAIFAATAWAILAARQRFVARTKMRWVGTVLAVLALFAGYFAYVIGYVALQAELEYRFTNLRTLCHLPGVLPRVLPALLAAAILFVSHLRSRKERPMSTPGVVSQPLEPRGVDELPTPGHPQYYAAFVSLVVHGQENKWWMLYVYLLFSSILVLACVALFGATGFGLAHQLILSLLCLAGLVVSASWIAMTFDYVDASNLFSDIAKDAEDQIPARLGRPLTRRAEQRSQKCQIGTLKFVALAIPIILGLTYALLLVLAWCKPAPDVHQQSEGSVPPPAQPHGIATQFERGNVPAVSEAYGAYRIGGEVKAPVVVSRREPRIPPNTPCRGLVQFRCVIDEHGNVTEIEDLSPVRDAFSRAYQEALQETKFRPGTLRGKPVSVEYAMSVNIRCR